MMKIIAAKAEITVYKEKCQQALAEITWRDSIPSLPNLELSEALKWVKDGQVINESDARRLEPK